MFVKPKIIYLFIKKDVRSTRAQLVVHNLIEVLHLGMQVHLIFILKKHVTLTSNM